MANRAELGADPDLARFRQELEVQKRSKYTVKHYTLSVRLFQDWLERQRGRPIPLAAATASDLKQYQIHLTTQKHYAKTTLYAAIKALQAFYRFLKSTAAQELRPPRRGQPLPKYLTEAEAQRLRAASTGPLDRAVVSLLLYGGLRVGELCRLTIEGTDFEERTIRIQNGKGDKDRLVVIGPQCVEDLRAWLLVRPASSTDYVFPAAYGPTCITERSVQRLVIKNARAAGLAKKVTPHVLRHTLATTLLRRGADIRFIQRILGHASIATTQIYTHLDDADLKRMYDRAGPNF